MLTKKQITVIKKAYGRGYKRTNDEIISKLKKTFENNKKTDSVLLLWMLGIDADSASYVYDKLKDEQ